MKKYLINHFDQLICLMVAIYWAINPTQDAHTLGVLRGFLWGTILIHVVRNYLLTKWWE